jgi:hypothetical protein
MLMLRRLFKKNPAHVSFLLYALVETFCKNNKLEYACWCIGGLESKPCPGCNPYYKYIFSQTGETVLLL